MTASVLLAVTLLVQQPGPGLTATPTRPLGTLQEDAELGADGRMRWVLRRQTAFHLVR